MTNSTPYVGRYAPSPTGDLHLGNLQTALLAWLHARLHSGQFLMRMEDIDTPRVVEGSAEANIRDLVWLGIDWDGPISYQSERHALYDQAFDGLQAHNKVFPCFCSRKDIREAASAPHGAAIAYPGTCRNLSAAEQAKAELEKAPSFRLRCNQCEDDFVLKRADGIYAYHLVVTVDDLEQGIIHVVRGADLEDSQAQQRQLAKYLAPDRNPLEYISVPLKFDEAGDRMSKRFGSESAQAWRDRGLSGPQLATQLAKDLGLVDGSQTLSCSELLDSINLQDWQRAVRQLS